MRRTGLRTALGAVCLIAVLGAVPAAADPPLTKPNGPWQTPNQNESLASLRYYPELIATLERIVASSHGAARLSYSPYRAKDSGRQIPIVTIGHGDRAMMVIANQHGNEYVVSNSAIEIIRALTANSDAARTIRDELTVTVMPRVNVDGFDGTPTGSPWRYNVDPDVCPTGPCPAFYARNQGYDINRYHSYLRSDPLDDPNTGPIAVGQGDNPVPEALAVRNAYDAAGGSDKVEVMIDLHHQGTRIDAQGDMVTASTLWPNATQTADQLGIRPQFDDVIFRSKQVVSTLLQGVERYGFANFSRYPGTLPPGISRNAYGLLGSASVLIEIRGDVGQKSGGYLAKTAYLAVASVVDALADRSLYSADVGVAESLQEAPVADATLFDKCMANREYTLENYNACREKLGLSPVSTLPPAGE
jgi:predicted deacylase